MIMHRAPFAILGLLTALAVDAGMRPGGAAGATQSAPCSAAEFRQFDFFAGDWDTYDVAAPSRIIARNQVTIVLGGCVVHEVYRQTDGEIGESFSIYDASRRVWHQSWVTNRGVLLLLDGGFDAGRMVLTGREQAADGTSSLLRGIWVREVGAVRETAERSSDGGRTWRPVFDIRFRPHRQREGQ